MDVSAEVRSGILQSKEGADKADEDQSAALVDRRAAARERRGVGVVQLYRSVQEREAHVSRADSSIRLQSVGADRLDRALLSRPPPISDAGGETEPNDDGAVAACRADPRTCSRFRRPRTALGCRSGSRACSDMSVISGPTELARASTAGRDRTRCAASAVGRVNGLSV